MYSEKVMDHFNNPRNVGEIENPSGVGTVGNAKCGDMIFFQHLLKHLRPQHLRRDMTIYTVDYAYVAAQAS